MGISQIFGAIYGIIKAVPIIDGWVQQFLEFFVLQKVKEIEDFHSSKQAKATVILFNLKKATTHEEKRVLMSLLADTERL
jgi:hypothetical protein